MNLDSTSQVLFVTNHQAHVHSDLALASLATYLHKTSSLCLERTDEFPEDLSAYQAVMLTNAAGLSRLQQHTLSQFVQAGGGVLALTGMNEERLPHIFGAEPCQIGPYNELRILFTDRNDQLRNRLPEAAYLQGRYHHLHQRSDGVETVLYADWQFDHSSVLTRHRVGNGQASATTLQDFSNPWLQQVLFRLLRQLSGVEVREKALGVGLLGYSPAVGLLHGTGATETMGLDLCAICDLSPRRRAEAQRDFPAASIRESVDSLREDNAVDVVIVATPPNSHAKLAVELLNAGKHVVCEKPLAITTVETDAMLNAAERNNRFVGCHQNRRWDVDYLVVKEAVTQNRIGDLFYMETFVGSFSHPCGYWHSHDAISGGTTYDWGAHYLDWTLSLIPDTVTSIVSTRQNRVWHDVSNADQERIQLRFANGQEADFTHSDIAAVRKPKWYLLGTEGAIVGNWRDVSSYEIDALRYFNEHNIPSTEMPPDLRLYRHLRPDGEETNRTVEERMALPQRRLNGFHRNLADHLLTGEPIEVPAAHSARVVAVLEQAARSAEQGGTLELVDI